MISQTQVTNAKNPRTIYGLSSDSKPTENIANASVFFEMDTSKAYMFDEENTTWREL